VKLPLDPNIVLSFFGFLTKSATALDMANCAGIECDEKPMSVSHLTGFRSAIIDLYKNAGPEAMASWNQHIELELKKAGDGYSRLMNQFRQKGLVKINEGKRHLRWDGYSMIARKFMLSEPKRNQSGEDWDMVLFGWSFYVLTWNLMSRGDSSESLMLQHITWSEDALIVEEQGHKGDQTGEAKFGKHVYANPIEPHTCPILSLAVLLFCTTRKPGGRQQVFLGTNSRDRFGHLLTELKSTFTNDDWTLLGCKPEDIGTHSLRKGSSTYALGQVSGPSSIAVFLRMGQSLGKLKDRYIFTGQGADELCGRMVCGLPYNEVDFAVLPPQFVRETQRKMNHSFWQNIVDGYDNYPVTFRPAFPFLLASLVYHEDFLVENLNVEHPIFIQRWRTQNDLLPEMRQIKNQLSYGYSQVTGLKATGIPVHIALTREIKELTTQMTALEAKLLEIERYNAELIKEKVRELQEYLPTAVSATLRQDFNIEGVTSLTYRDMDSRMEGMESRLQTHVAQQMHSLQETLAKLQGQISNNHTTRSESDYLDSSWFKTWGHGNDGFITHFVPPEWEFPARITTKTLWDLWWFGDKNSGIRPYCLLTGSDIKRVRTNKMRRSRAKVTMSFFIDVGIELKLLNSRTERIKSISLCESDALYAKLYAEVLKKLRGGDIPSREEAICYGTIYTWIRDFKKK
jgi:hypothetical protein